MDYVLSTTLNIAAEQKGAKLTSVKQQFTTQEKLQLNANCVIPSKYLLLSQEVGLGECVGSVFLDTVSPNQKSRQDDGFLLSCTVLI